MSHSPSKVRRALVGAGTIAVVLGIVYVVLRMGPLAATQVTVQRVERGRKAMVKRFPKLAL